MINLGNFGERCFGLRSEVALVQLSYAIQRVDLLDRLVVADAHDAGKAQGITAGVAARMLNRIERDLEHYLGPHHARPASIGDIAVQETLRHLGDLRLAEP